MSGVIGRIRKVPENTKHLLMDAKDKSLTAALINTGERFGHANREALKTIGQGVRRRK